MRTVRIVLTAFVLGSCVHTTPEPASHPNQPSTMTAPRLNPESAALKTNQPVPEELSCSGIPEPQGHIVLEQAGFQVWRAKKDQRSIDTIVTPPHGEQHCRGQILASPEGLRCKTNHDRPTYRCRPVGFAERNGVTFLIARQQVYRFVRETGITDFILEADFGDIEFAGTSPAGDTFAALKDGELVGILIFERGRWQIFPPRNKLSKKSRSMLAMDITRLERKKGARNEFVLSFTNGGNKLIVLTDDQPLDPIADNR